MFKSVSAAITTALLAVSLVSVAAPQAAQATTDALSFDCTAIFYQASNGDFYHFDTTSLTYSKDTRFANINSFNALGWNPGDNHIYGFDGSNKLVKLNNDGSTDGGRTVSGTTPETTGGTFLSSDHMLTVGSGNFTTVDLSANPPVGANFITTSQGGASWGAADIAYYPTGNVGYGMDGNNLDVATFDANDTQATVSTRAVTFADIPSGTTAPSGGNAWGAAYVDGDGNGYFFNNSTYGLYVIYAADLSSAANPVTAHWKVTANSLNSPNDGASCPTAAAPAGLAPSTPTPAPASYAVNFDSQGGTAFASTTYSNGGCVDVDRTPTRAGYNFIGWFVAPVANTMLSGTYCPGSTGDITLYAHWSPISYQVNYNSQGGSATPSSSYTTGNPISLAAAPTRAGYSFGGWSLSPSAPISSATASPYTPATTGNITFYAIWTASNYAVTFDPNGGTPTQTGSYTTGGSLPLATSPTRAGYTFSGWFLAATGGSALTSPYTPATTGPLTLFAQWAPNSYKVSFNTRGGASVNDGSYTTAGCLDLPAAPARSGYTFSGWFTSTDAGTALASPFCPSGTGDLTLYAQWTQDADPTPAPPVKRAPVTVVVSGFAAGSPALSKAMKAKIDAFLTTYSDYKSIRCVGFTEGPTILKTDKALSLARANNSCSYALAGLANGLKEKPVQFGNHTVAGAQLRRVEITLTDD